MVTRHLTAMSLAGPWVSSAPGLFWAFPTLPRVTIPGRWRPCGDFMLTYFPILYLALGWGRVVTAPTSFFVILCHLPFHPLHTTAASALGHCIHWVGILYNFCHPGTRL